MTSDEKKVIGAFYNDSNYDKTIWSGDLCDAIVTTEIFEEVLFRKHIHGDFIDWYANYLTRNGTKICIIFGTWARVFLLANDEDGIYRLVTREIEQNLRYDTQFLMFPFISEMNHWVLLVLDVQTWEWSLYDSYRALQPDEENPYLKDIRKTKAHIHKEVAKGATHLKMAVLRNKTVELNTCPQQPEHSNNCALYVCYFIEHVLNKSAYNMSQD